MDRDIEPQNAAQAAGDLKTRPDFAQLFEVMPGQYMILDRDLVYVEANPAYCTSTERKREEIIGRYVFEAFPPTGEGGRQIEASLRRVLATGVAETLPLAAYPIPTPDGGFRTKYWSCAHLPLFDENGEVAFVVQNAVDVTELQNLKTLAYGPDPGAPARGESDLFRRALEVTAVNDSLAAETKGLRDLFMQAPSFIAVLTGPDLIYTQVNNAYLQLIGHRPVIGQSLADALPEVIEQGFGELLLKVMRDRAPHIGWATSVMLQREPGAPLEERFVDFVYQPIAGSEGESLGVFVEGSDVTDRVRAEQALRHSEEQLRLATEAAEVGFWDVDGSTGALFWPPIVKAMFGISPDVPVTMEDFFAGLHPEDQDATTAAYQAAVDPSRRSLYDVEYRTVGKEDRVVRWVAAKGRALFDEDGRCIRVIGAAIDITRRKTAETHLRELNETLQARIEEALREQAATEEALRQSQKMEAVGQLTGGIAHDFNNLLAGITGNLELLNTRVSQGRIEAIPRYLDAAQGAAKRAAALTQRLLAFSRRQTLDPRPADVNRLIANMEELLRRSMGPDISIEVVGTAGLWATLIDHSQLENALLNLCINARDAMPNGGRLTIETANKWLDENAARQRELSPGQYISLCVTDTGTGMTPDVVARAFDPFFTTKPLGQGTGLGLSMIYGFVRQSGGQVRIYSEVGQGTTMCLYLPRYVGKVSPDEDEPASHAFDASHGETVLIVDDEPTVRMLMVDVLGEAGYRILEAEDASQGLKILQTAERVDLLVTDVGLPGGMNGRQLADAGRTLRPELKVLFITGFAENAVVGNGHLDAGMQVMTKPFAVEMLGNKVREMLDL